MAHHKNTTVFPLLPITRADGGYIQENSLLCGEADLDLVQAVVFGLAFGAAPLAAVDVDVEAVTLVTWRERGKCHHCHTKDVISRESRAWEEWIQLSRRFNY